MPFTNDEIVNIIFIAVIINCIVLLAYDSHIQQKEWFGSPGAPGSPGAQGFPGHDGSIGPRGLQGPQGTSNLNYCDTLKFDDNYPYECLQKYSGKFIDYGIKMFNHFPEYKKINPDLFNQLTNCDLSNGVYPNVTYNSWISYKSHNYSGEFSDTYTQRITNIEKDNSLICPNMSICNNLPDNTLITDVPISCINKYLKEKPFEHKQDLTLYKFIGIIKKLDNMSDNYTWGKFKDDLKISFLDSSLKQTFKKDTSTRTVNLYFILFYAL